MICAICLLPMLMYIPPLCMLAAKVLVSLHICTDSPEPLLFADGIVPKSCNWQIYTHYHNSNWIWRTVSRRVDEVIPSDPMVWPHP